MLRNSNSRLIRGRLGTGTISMKSPITPGPTPRGRAGPPQPLPGPLRSSDQWPSLAVLGHLYACHHRQRHRYRAVALRDCWFHSLKLWSSAPDPPCVVAATHQVSQLERGRQWTQRQVGGGKPAGKQSSLHRMPCAPLRDGPSSLTTLGARYAPPC